MKYKNVMAPSPRQPLNGQGVRRISGLGNPNKWVGVRFGSWNIGSLCGRGTEVTEELRRRMVDVCCLQEVRWRGQGSRFIGVQGRRYKLWWSGNDAGNGGVGILVKEELCESVLEVRRKSDRVMAMGFVFKQEIVRVICGYAPQTGRPALEKERFYDEMAYEWDMQGTNELVLGLGDFNGHVGNDIEGFEGVHGGNGIGKRNVEGRMLLEFCDQKELCVANTWYRKKDQRKVTFSASGNETEIDFVLIGKDYRRYLRDVKVIAGQLQHNLVVADMEKMKLTNRVEKSHGLENLEVRGKENQSTI